MSSQQVQNKGELPITEVIRRCRLWIPYDRHPRQCGELIIRFTGKG